MKITKTFFYNTLPLILLLIYVAETRDCIAQKYIIRHRLAGYSPPEINLQNFRLQTLGSALYRPEEDATGKYYLIMQFYQLPSESDKNKMKQYGIKFLEYVPKYAFYVSIPENLDISSIKSFSIRSLDTIRTLNKIDPGLLNGNIPVWAVPESGMADIVLTCFSDCNPAATENFLQERNIEILRQTEYFNSFYLRLPVEMITDLARQPFVMDISPVPSPKKEANHEAKIRTKSHFLQQPASLGGSGLTGAGVNLGIFDAGTTSWHIDFRNRLTEMETDFWSDHPTLCLASAAGGGIRMPYAQGMAPKMNLFAWSAEGYTLSKLEQGIINQGINISSHSYYGGGEPCGFIGNYDDLSRTVDIVHLNHPEVLTFYSAGNSASDCPDGWGTVPSGEQTGKNILTIGALDEHYEEDIVALFSCRGPLTDGRVKPELTATGVNITTCGRYNSYVTVDGTSSSTPIVAGLAGQLYERYHQLFANENPDAALMKAILCNTADDIENPGPDYKVGFGRVNGRNALNALNNNWYLKDTISQGEVNTHSVDIPAGTSQVKILLYWADHEAIPSANPALVNNLNLQVTPFGSTSFNPWVLNPANPDANAVRGIDSLNNIEQVTIDNPNSGPCTITVSAPEVPFGPQPYYIVYEFITNYVQVTFPLGGEFLSPGQQEQISWDSYGMSGPYSVEFSKDDGNTWHLLGQVPNPDQKFFLWTPHVNDITNLGKVRISCNGFSSQSQNAFNLFPIPLNLKMVPYSQRVELFWDEVPQANYYEVFQLVDGEWSFLDTASSTNYSATGLTNQTEYWFTVRAKGVNNETGNFAYAMNATPSDYSAVNIYTYKCSSFPSAYQDFTDGTVGITGDDSTALVQLPFSFKYTGVFYDTIRYGTNGWIQMGNLPQVSTDKNVLMSADRFMAPLWDNLEVDDSASIRYKISGIAPDRVFCIEFKNLRTRNRNISWYEWSRLNFQIKLFETSNNIEFSYGEHVYYDVGSISASIGLTGKSSGSMNFISVNLSTLPSVPHTFNSIYPYDILGPSMVYTLVNNSIKFEYCEFPFPILSYPPDGSHSNPTDLTLKWNPVNNATSYRLQVSSSGTFSGCLVDEVVSGTNFEFDSLDYHKLYYWRVSARTAADSSLWSETFRFTTKMSAPVQISPVNHSTNVSLQPNFSWHYVTGAGIYGVQVSTSGLFDPDQTSTSYTPFGFSSLYLEEYTSYYWRVYAKSGPDSSDFSETWRFTTLSLNPVLTIPVLISPPDNQVNVPVSVLLSWSSDPFATSYNVQLSSEESFNAPEINTSVPDTFLSPPGLASGNHYYWRVRSMNGLLTGEWSDVWRFTTLGENMVWMPQTNPISNGVYSIFFINNDVGWAVGYLGTILHTTDGGNNWTTLSTGIYDDLFSVCFADKDTGWAAGNNGLIIKTTDGGTNWSVKSSGIFPNFRSISFANSRTGWVAGYGGIIVKTTDGGENWVQLQSGTTFDLSGICFPDENNGYTVSYAPYNNKYKTYDGGTVWTLIPAGTPIEISGMYFKDANNGLIVGSQGKIYKTSNGGANWGLVLNLATSSFYAVHETDFGRAWAVGPDGSIFRSTDDGQTWSRQTSGTSNTLSCVFFSDANTGWAASNSGEILKHLDTLLIPPKYPDPADHTGSISHNPDLSWNAVKAVTSYRVQVSSDSSFSSLIVDESVSETNLSVSGLETNARYYWRVCSMRNADLSVWSSTWSFTTAPEQPRDSLSGKVTYDNAAFSPLTGTTVYLKENEALVNVTTTDSTGHYFFMDLPVSAFSLDASSAKPWGGVNSADALAVMKHFAGMQYLSGIRLEAADVNGDGYFNAVDALLIARRFVSQINSFPVGDWVFEKKTVETNGSGSVNMDFKGLCYGDVNGTHTPSARLIPTITCKSAETFGVSDSHEFILPVYSNRELLPGAASLVFNYQPDLLEITGVRFPYDNENLLYNTIGNELRISWYSLTPQTIRENEPQLWIKLKPLTNLKEDVMMSTSPESELNDADGVVYQDITLRIPKLVPGSPSDFYLDYNRPNPFSTKTEITWSMPEAGKVTLKIFNLLGSEVAEIVNNQEYAGHHSVVLNGSALEKGVYLYRIEIQGNNRQFTKTRMMLVE